MTLPANTKAPWPPALWAPFAADIATADAWYSGDVNTLDSAHGMVGSGGRNPIVRAWERIGGRDNTLRSANATTQLRLHVPVAADVAAVGADLLFGEGVTFTIPDAHGASANPEAAATEARLGELALLDGWSSALIEGAEICGGLGGVFLRPVVDLDISDHPMLTVVHPDVAYPEFKYGRLVALTFWEAFIGEKGAVWRHLERYERGTIEHGLYLGSATELGSRVDLSMRPETAGFVTDVTDPYGGGLVDLVAIGTPPLMLPRYVPNALPNRRHRTKPVGRADCAGSEQLLDGLDETWTSWVRDIRLAKARLIVPDAYLDRNGRGQGATFDPDRELFSPLEMDPAHADKAGIQLIQPLIRWEEHARTCEALFTAIVQGAGYSPQSFGLPGDGGSQTATEIDSRDARSEATTERKQEYWRRALEDVAENMLWLDKAMCGGAVTPMRPMLHFPEPEDGPSEQAATLNLLNSAKAASIETRVKYLHPDWEPDQVVAEVARIKAEDGYMVADPTGGLVP